MLFWPISLKLRLLQRDIFSLRPTIFIFPIYPSNQLNLIIRDLTIQPAPLNPLDDLGHQAVDVIGIIGDGHGRDDRRLPGVEVIDLGDGDVELVPQPGDDAFDDPPLIFERGGGNIQFDSTDSDNHKC